MDLGLDSLLEAEIKRQTDGADTQVPKEDPKNSSDEEEPPIQTNGKHTNKDNATFDTSDYQWIHDITEKEMEKYSDLALKHEEITDQNITQSDISLRCNLYIHQILSKWGQEIEKQQGLDGKKDSEDATIQQREELFHDTKMSLFPLLVQLRKATLPRNQLVSVATILFHLQRQEWDLALQSYMQLSLGNVAWPIGVTSVGIHARSAHSKITGQRTRPVDGDHRDNNTSDTQSDVATIMLDDSTRKWTTSLKRLLTVEKNLSVPLNSSSST